MQDIPGAFDGGSDDVGSSQPRPDADPSHDEAENHLALIYESQAEQFATVVPFVRAGLERGERCFYVVDDNSIDEMVEAMTAAGIDVAAARERGQLSFHAPAETCFDAASFEPAETITFQAETAEDAVAEGYDGVRYTGEMTWAVAEDGTAHDALTAFEARVNRLYPDASMTGLCQYNRERFPPDVLADVLRTHPTVATEGGRYANDFYVPPGEFLAEGTSASTVDRQLRRVTSQRDRRDHTRELRDLLGAVLESATTASTRDVLERAVCERLADVDGWQFAWVAETNATSEQLTPRTTAGEGASYLESVTVQATDDPAAEPTGRAAATGSLQVVDDVAAAPDDAAWRRQALARGFRSVAAAPLVYEGVSYGVVSVYADEPGAFGEQARATLADVGRAAGFACNAMERRSALVSDHATELALRIGDDDPFVDFVTRVDATVTVDGVVPDPAADAGDDWLQVFFTVDGSTREQVDAAAATVPSFTSSSLVSERDGTLAYDVLVDGSGLLGTLLDHAVVPKSVEPDGEFGRVVVRLPPSTDVASFVGMLQERSPGAELVARREVEHESTTRRDFRTQLEERLTDRQWEAIQTAYLSGYFEWPRERSGEEVGERLGVSQPTFNRHLRDSLRKLLTPVFDDEMGRD